MILMGMQYAKSAPGMGGTIRRIVTHISSSELLKLYQHTMHAIELDLTLKPNVPSQSDFFQGIPEYFPILQNLSLHYMNSLKGLIDVLPKLVMLTKLEITFTLEDKGIEYWHPFDHLS